MWTEKNLYQFADVRSNAECTFSSLGFVDSPYPNSLTFAQSQNYLQRAIENPNIAAVLTTTELAGKAKSSNKLLICKEPKVVFFQFHNLISNDLVKEFKSMVHKTARVAQTAKIESHNVIIGPKAIIEDFCVIKRNTQIGEKTIIQTGTIIGSTGIYVAEDSAGNRFLGEHFGQVEIGDNVNIGSNSVIDKGIFPKDKTFIASNNFIGSLSKIGHGVEIQEGNTLGVGVCVCGYTKLGFDNWIGPGAIISHKLDVGSRNYIALGSTLFRSIQDDTKVIANKIFTNRSLF
jgi:UDP-3-O-[3-hydroxymyristoyl] glucosamine N-acyltransferase